MSKGFDDFKFSTQVQEPYYAREKIILLRCLDRYKSRVIAFGR